MPDADTISRRTRAAVEKAARRFADASGCENCQREEGGMCGCEYAAAAIILDYLLSQGRNIEADQVKRIRDE